MNLRPLRPERVSNIIVHYHEKTIKGKNGIILFKKVSCIILYYEIILNNIFRIVYRISVRVKIANKSIDVRINVRYNVCDR